MKHIYYVAEEDRVKSNGLYELISNLYIPNKTRKEARQLKKNLKKYPHNSNIKIYKVKIEEVR